MTDRQWLTRVMTGLLLVTVLGQRFALPLGSSPVSVVLVAAYVALGLLAWRGLVRHDLLRTELCAAALVLCGTAAWLATWPGEPLSVTSLLLLLALWVPWVAVVRDDLRPVATLVVGRFVTLMVGAAAVAAAQLGAQLAGLWRYTDVLADLVPPQWLLLVFNTSIPVVYDSPVHKANAFVFLEPSFLSQYCALGVVAAVLLRRPAWQVVTLLLGMVVALSGSGFLVLAVGLAVVVVRRPRLVRPAYAVTAAVAVVATLLSPAAPLLLERSGELSQVNSSGWLRFVAPYTEAARGLAADSVRWVIGAGPGTAERLLESDRGRAGAAVVYSIPAKLAFEYGLVAATAFLVFLVVVLFRRAHVVALPAALAVVLLVVSGSLLQPQTVVLAWLLVGVWAGTARTTGPPGVPPDPVRAGTRTGTAPTPSG